MDLPIDKSITFGKSDLINIDFIDQSVEIDDTPYYFINLPCQDIMSNSKQG